MRPCESATLKGLHTIDPERVSPRGRIRTMEIALGILIGLLVAGIGCAYLLAARKGLTRQRDEKSRACDELKATIAERERAIEGYAGRIDDLQQQLSTKEKQFAVIEQREHGLREQFDAAQKQARETFQSLAGQALKQASDQFLQLAAKTFDGEKKDAAAQLEQRKQAIDAMLKPIREALDKHAAVVTTVEKERKSDQGSLRQQITSMLESQKQLESETKNLANALRQTSVRGRWGELSLRRIAEMAGMVAHCDFDEQVTIWTGDERQRPDMVINLPSQRTIVVDAKAPMAAYLDALNAQNDGDRDRFFKQHLTNVESRISELAKKDYGQRLARAADFVVLFIPGDSFLSPAVQMKPDMIESALSRGVVIATPTTLISLLRVIELGWREQRIAENAQRIRDIGVDLHERIATVVEKIAEHGKHLQRSVSSYNALVGSYESRVMVSARKFKELGADSSKELPAEGELKQIEQQPRELRSTESVTS